MKNNGAPEIINHIGKLCYFYEIKTNYTNGIGVSGGGGPGNGVSVSYRCGPTECGEFMGLFTIGGYPKAAVLKNDGRIVLIDLATFSFKKESLS